MSHDRPFQRIPVTILTGFLGAGKTTLLNRLLHGAPGEKIAVIVNEFGSVGIDGSLVVGGSETLVEMDNGCICCTVRNDLIETLTDLVKRKLGMEGTDGKRLQYDRVVIETTGLADPLPLLRTFLLDEVIGTCYEVDSVITVVDAKYIEKQLALLPLAAEQIALADLIILNKLDLVEKEEAQLVEKRLRDINPLARIETATDGNVAIRTLFGKRALRALPENFLMHHDDSHNHLDGIHSVVVQTESAMELSALYEWIGAVVEKCGPDLLRFKGIVYSSEWPEKRGVLQGVHSLYTVNPDRAWQAGEVRDTKIVFIGRTLDLDWIKESFARCVGRQN